MAALIVTAFLLLLVAFGSVANAASSDPNYTDGTTGSTPDGTDWGAPPQAPTLDVEEGSICIDPPSYVWMTIHWSIDGTDQEPLVFPYIHTTPGYACVPFELPVCPAGHVNAYGTWNIGTGQSPPLDVDIDQTDCPTPEASLNVEQNCDGTTLTLTNTGTVAFTVDSNGPFFQTTLEAGTTATADMGTDPGTVIVSFQTENKSGETSIEWSGSVTCTELVPPAVETAVAPPAPPTPPVAAAAPSLPVTGSHTDLLAIIGGLVLSVGIALLATAKRKSRKPSGIRF